MAGCALVSKDDEFCIQNEKIVYQKRGIVYQKTRNFVFKMMNFCLQRPYARPSLKQSWVDVRHTIRGEEDTGGNRWRVSDFPLFYLYVSPFCPHFTPLLLQGRSALLNRRVESIVSDTMTLSGGCRMRLCAYLRSARQ